jgi:hypothetical protein
MLIFLQFWWFRVYRDHNELSERLLPNNDLHYLPSSGTMILAWYSLFDIGRKLRNSPIQKYLHNCRTLFNKSHPANETNGCDLSLKTKKPFLYLSENENICFLIEKRVNTTKQISIFLFEDSQMSVLKNSDSNIFYDVRVFKSLYLKLISQCLSCWDSDINSKSECIFCV